MVGIIFDNPEYLFLLLAIPIVIFLHFMILKSSNKKAIAFSNFEAIARIKGIDVYSKNIVVLVLTCILVFSLVFVAAGAKISTSVLAGDISYVIAIDSSRSMEANDVLPSRLNAAKETAQDFIDDTRLGTRIGVLSFSGAAFIEQDLTEDKLEAKLGVSGILPSSIGGTDLLAAVVSAGNLLEDEEGKSLVLISDGQTNLGTLEQAIGRALKEGIVVHTIAVGTEEGGETSFGISKTDLDSLEALAFNTGGEFFRAESAVGITESLETVGELKIKRVFFDLSNYLILLSLIIVFIQYILVNGRYRVFP